LLFKDETNKNNYQGIKAGNAPLPTILCASRVFFGAKWVNFILTVVDQ
jgi:hypothetical protein